MFDGVGEDFSLALAVGTGILLGADDDGFGAVTLLILFAAKIVEIIQSAKILGAYNGK